MEVALFGFMQVTGLPACPLACGNPLCLLLCSRPATLCGRSLALALAGTSQFTRLWFFHTAHTSLALIFMQSTCQRCNHYLSTTYTQRPFARLCNQEESLPEITEKHSFRQLNAGNAGSSAFPCPPPEFGELAFCKPDKALRCVDKHSAPTEKSPLRRPHPHNRRQRSLPAEWRA